MLNIHSKDVFVFDQDLPWEQIDDKVRRKIMAYDANLMVVQVEFKATGIGSIHQHEHIQISYVASGVFEITIADEIKILKKGDVFMIPSNVLHGAICIEDGVLIDAFNPMRDDFFKNT